MKVIAGMIIGAGLYYFCSVPLQDMLAQSATDWLYINASVCNDWTVAK